MNESESPVVGRRSLLQGAALAGAAALAPSRANSQTESNMSAISVGLSEDDIRGMLKLEPNTTCGFVRVTFITKQAIAAGGLPAPFADARPLGSALYFMVTPTAPV